MYNSSLIREAMRQIFKVLAYKATPRGGFKKKEQKNVFIK